MFNFTQHMLHYQHPFNDRGCGVGGREIKRNLQPWLQLRSAYIVTGIIPISFTSPPSKRQTTYNTRKEPSVCGLWTTNHGWHSRVGVLGRTQPTPTRVGSEDPPDSIGISRSLPSWSIGSPFIGAEQRVDIPPGFCPIGDEAHWSRSPPGTEPIGQSTGGSPTGDAGPTRAPVGLPPDTTPVGFTQARGTGGGPTGCAQPRGTPTGCAQPRWGPHRVRAAPVGAPPGARGPGGTSTGCAAPVVSPPGARGPWWGLHRVCAAPVGVPPGVSALAQFRWGLHRGRYPVKPDGSPIGASQRGISL
ncbi:hypothetical protein Taro_002942 [Colocasia esculenta]|uniref:Uncharacterized protein n=1 Tax=Colocasia esculenta TaxID=4460 RepID=A0A843THW8_COLES|nr:hypothetical protein [Colocasia esculenta]